MLEQYFSGPTTVDRIRASWIREAIEQYVSWLAEQGYAASNVPQRVPILLRFGDFAREHGVTTLGELSDCVEPFIHYWLNSRKRSFPNDESHNQFISSIRGPICQFLRAVLPGYHVGIRGHDLQRPFINRVPKFFDYLANERGLSTGSLYQYDHHLRCFEAYLVNIGLIELTELSPAVLSGYITERGQTLSKRSVQRFCSVLKVFLSYLSFEGLTQRDLSPVIVPPRNYRYSNIPRSITWCEVKQLLASIDRCRGVGKRDYAILLLLVTYGLRAREVAALRLKDIDWRRERLHVPGRKAGHSTTFPLSPIVGQAIVDYLREVRPPTTERTLFLRARAPHTSVSHSAISQLTKRSLINAGFKVHRPGSHTLRHTCVQRLVDAHISLKTIGDYMGHRTAVATGVYAKIDIDALREVALGDGEALL
ncbi:MAG: integrase/recombinase XerD [Candidatus Azotimanducaceae bacterium]|jgi:integrase/recombinase XerD